MRTSVKGYCQTAGSVWKRVRAKTIEVECIGSTHDINSNLLSELWCKSQDVHWIQVLCLACYTWVMHSMDPLLAHGLTVKLNPCPCSQCSPGWTNNCMSVGIPNAIWYSLRLAPGWFSIFLVDTPFPGMLHHTKVTPSINGFLCHFQPIVRTLFWLLVGASTGNYSHCDPNHTHSLASFR